MTETNMNPIEEATETVQSSISAVDNRQTRGLTEGLVRNETEAQNAYDVSNNLLFLEENLQCDSHMRAIA